MSYLLSLLLGVWPKAAPKEQTATDIVEKWHLVKVHTPIEKVIFYKLVATNKPKI